MAGKVLIITYYWPPSGGGGVQRWLKFTKYLPQFDWEPIVFTPENPAFDLKDASLAKDVSESVEVIKFPIWEPFGVYKKLFGKSSDKNLQQGVVIEKSNLSMLDKAIIWIRGNLFIPDSRKYWVKPSVQFLIPYIAAHQVDVVITTGPPHSMHLIGRNLKRKTNIKWIADFRDPWSDWDILDKLQTSNWAKSRHRKQEKSVLSEADIVLTVTRKMGQLFAEKCDADKVQVITNGIDEADVKITENPWDKFRITHLGLLNELRDPVVLWEVLEELCREVVGFSSDLEIVLSGTISRSIVDRINSYKHVQNAIVFHDYIPHGEIFEHYSRSSLLLLLMNQTTNADWLIPAKLFEYLAANRTILAFGTQASDVNDILQSVGGDGVLDYQDRDEIRKNILVAYNAFMERKPFAGYSQVDRFYRKQLTEQLANLLSQLTNQ